MYYYAKFGCSKSNSVRQPTDVKNGTLDTYCGVWLISADKDIKFINFQMKWRKSTTNVYVCGKSVMMYRR